MFSKNKTIAFLLFLQCFAFAQLQDSHTSAQPSKNQNALQEDDEKDINTVISVINDVEEHGNFVHQLNPDSLASLPLGIIKQIGNTRYVIGIDSMKFKPNGAYFSAYAAIDFPGTLKKLAFKASNVKFNPSGVISGEQARLYLVSNHLIRINATVSLRLKNNGQNWVEWDCNGFKAINLAGDFIFNKGKLIPDASQTSDTVVTAAFQIYTQHINDFITAVNITPFQIAGLQDWSFKVTNAIVDMSELQNSPTMLFPNGYNNPNLLTPQMWTGFSLQSLTIKLPHEISKAGQRSQITVNNLLIDNMGVSGMFKVNNLFSINEGSMSGWRFSLEEISASFITNQLSGGELKGRIHLPVMDSTQSLAYTANMNYNYSSGQINYAFIINPVSNISFKAFSANLSLNNNSKITFVKEGSTFKPSANLNGLIAFDHAKFNSNGGKLAFQDLTLTTEAPYITNGVFSLNTINGGQTRAVNYPVSINDITFGINQGVPILGFSVTLNLSDQGSNSLSVGTSILLRGKIETGQKTYSGPEPVTYNITRWKYDKTILNGFNIDIQTSPFTLKGAVVFKDDDPIYGDAFLGSLSMSIQKVMQEPAAVSVCFGSKEDYRFFYVDAKVPVAFNLGGLPVKITGLMGGLYYHMSPNKTSETEFISLNKSSPSVAGNALSYVPNNNVSLGLKAGVSYEYSLSQVPYNGDLMLEINFTSTGGLGTVALVGDVYSMASVSNRDKAPVKGRMSMYFDVQNKVFDALAQVNINSYQVITGVGYFKIHFDPELWYLKIGSPSNPNNISILNMVNAPFYFMVGNSLEPPMAPPPAVAQISSVASVLGDRNQSQLQSGGGFCTGARISASLTKTFGVKFFNVSGSYNFDMGFDLMMTNYGPDGTCGNQKIGMAGWLVNGAVYLHMAGAVTINGNFKFPPGCPSEIEVCVPFFGCSTWSYPCMIDKDFSFTVFSADVTAVIAARAPKPVFFEGVLNCSYNIFDKVDGEFVFDFSYGEKCVPVSN